MSEPTCLDAGYEREACKQGLISDPVFPENLQYVPDEINMNGNIHLTAPSTDDYGSHYRYTYKGIKLDPYRILDVYKVTHPAHQHAIKKLLRLGKSVKDTRRDLQEVILTLERWLEMLDEDGK